jgi:hypothetical protein
MDVLDRIPVATLIAIASIVIIVIACVRNDMTVQEGLIALGAIIGGGGILGIARAQSGKGIAQPPR